MEGQMIFDKMKNIAIIPARSGSKGLKDKNIKKLSGTPLLVYSIKAAQKSGVFTDIMVSTDSEQYANIARKNGASVPFLRSRSNSDDNAGSWDVVKEVIEKYALSNKIFDTVCLLQPTSPMRTADDIIGAYDELIKKNAEAITSVCETDHSPLWCMKLDSDYSLKYFRKSLKYVPRQKLDKYYRLNGAIFIRKIAYNNDTINILEKDEYAYIMSRDRSVDIDTIDDFEYAEFLISKNFK